MSSTVIPKLIHQTFETCDLSSGMQSIADSWKFFNPEPLGESARLLRNCASSFFDIACDSSHSPLEGPAAVLVTIRYISNIPAEQNYKECPPLLFRS
jgi:hypothetical protein